MNEILRYLVQHPDAKDTIDGIARWWLPPDHQGWKREQVQHAIEELVARGWIIRRETTPSHVVYGLDKEHLITITNVLRKRSGGAANP
jgi:hypothetical protein